MPGGKALENIDKHNSPLYKAYTVGYKEGLVDEKIKILRAIFELLMTEKRHSLECHACMVDFKNRIVGEKHDPCN
jgi:hypothetical protein